MRVSSLSLLTTLLVYPSRAFVAQRQRFSSPQGVRFTQHQSIVASLSSTTAANNEEGAIFEPIGKGIRRDYSNRLPEYASDIRDGLNAQSLATVMFLFFACLAPAIGFGSVLNQLTAGNMGVIEMVLSTSLSGVLYALCSAQPVQLIGPQGPVVAFIVALYQLASSLNLPFWGLYAWTGLWTSGFLLVMSLTSCCNLARYFTRWTDETFSVLVSVIFLQQAARDVSRTFLTSSTQPLVALWTLVTCGLTLGTSLTLKSLPKSRYLTKSIRKQLSNFAPAIGVAVGSYAAQIARSYSGTVLPALSLPASKVVTTCGRQWLLSLGGSGFPLWARFGAALPATLLAVLLYLDQNITARLVNHPRFGQTKGNRKSVTDGLHGDMLTLSALTAISSVFGLPWMCGAPTRSAAHVQALATTENNVAGTLENRVSGSAIHACIGIAAVAATPRRWLAQVPQSVLSGIFLYLGWTSLQGLQFWDRLKNLFKDKRDERFAAVHICVEYFFTVVQATCLYSMMRVTQSKFGVLSPLLIALLPVVRKLMIKSDLVDEEAMKVLDQ